MVDISDVVIAFGPQGRCRGPAVSPRSSTTRRAASVRSWSSMQPDARATQWPKRTPEVSAYNHRRITAREFNAAKRRACNEFIDRNAGRPIRRDVNAAADWIARRPKQGRLLCPRGANHARFVGQGLLVLDHKHASVDPGPSPRRIRLTLPVCGDSIKTDVGKLTTLGILQPRTFNSPSRDRTSGTHTLRATRKVCMRKDDAEP